MKLLALLCALLLLPAVAAAQEPTATPAPAPTAGIEDQAPGLDDDATGDEDTDDPVDDDDPIEGDDAYTCGTDGTDADYTYCSDEAPSAGTPRKRKHPPAAAVQTLAAGTLPYTGTSPGIIAAFGVALLMTGAGLRMIASSSSAVRSRSSVTWR